MELRVCVSSISERYCCYCSSSPCEIMQVISVLKLSMSYLIREYVHVLQSTYFTIWEAVVASRCKTNIWVN